MRSLAFLCALAVVIVATRASAQDARVEARPGGVVSIAADGTEIHAIQHAALRAPDGTLGTPAGPARVGARTFYGVGADLLELDVGRGKVVRRTRMPAAIESLAAAPDGANLAVVLVMDDGASSWRAPITMAPDARPAHGIWSDRLVEQWSARRDAFALIEPYDLDAEPRPQTTVGWREEHIALVGRQESTDFTNPFLPALRGTLFASAGNRDAAARAFAKAADLEGGTFFDLLMVSALLEDEDEREDARRAFARGVEGMRAAGMRPDRLQGLVTLMMMGVPKRAMARALAANDVARVDEIADRIATIAPRVEASDRAWSDLATWMRARGREDLAAKWRARADEAAGSLFGRVHRYVERVDMLLPFTGAAAIAIPLLALTAGARASGERRRRGAKPTWLPAPRALDVSGELVAIALVLGLLVATIGPLEAVARLSVAPVSLTADGIGSPRVDAWLASLAPSDARDRVMSYARAESEAVRTGGKTDAPAPDDATLATALGTMKWPPPPRSIFGEDFVPVEGWLRLLAATIAAYVLGAIIGRWAPGERTVASIVPAGGEAFRPFGGVAIALLGGAVLALKGGDRVLSDLGSLGSGGYFGMSSMPSAPLPSPPHTWAFVAIVSVVTLHFVVTWMEWVNRSRRSGSTRRRASSRSRG